MTADKGYSAIGALDEMGEFFSYIEYIYIYIYIYTYKYWRGKEVSVGVLACEVVVCDWERNVPLYRLDGLDRLFHTIIDTMSGQADGQAK